MILQKPIQVFILFLGIFLLTHSFQLSKPQESFLNNKIIDLQDDQLKGGSITNYEAWTNDTFAKSSQLNTIFSYITNNPVNLNNITKTINDALTYVIRGTRNRPIYHNKNQTAQFYLQTKLSLSPMVLLKSMSDSLGRRSD